MSLKQNLLGDYNVFIKDSTLIPLLNTLQEEYSNKIVFPEKSNVFKAFKTTSLKDLKIIVLGMDPYPQKGYATGLAFANPPGVNPISPSLEVIRENIYSNFYQENYLDMPLGDPYDYQFDYTLETWAKQGVLLLNSALTVVEHLPGSHSNIWYNFIKELLINISDTNTGIIYFLLGGDAKQFKSFIGKYNYIFEYEHPAYAVRKGIAWEFEGFVEANRILNKLYNTEIKWLNE